MYETIDFLEELLFDIQCDNEVTFCGEWDSKDKKLAESINIILEYLSKREDSIC